jgi:hypothetical protein
MLWNNNEISVFAGIGFNTLAEIIGRLRLTMPSLNYFLKKGPTLQEQKKCPEKAANQKSRLLMILVE